MSDIPESPTAEPTPRTWMPLIIALCIAAVVVIGAVVVSSLRSGMSAPKAAAVEACEAAHAESGEGGEAPSRIVAGDVYGSSQWRDLRSFLIEQGVVEDADLPAGEAAERDDAAEALAAAGSDTITVVWWLDSEEHLACTADVEGDAVVPDSVVLRSLDSLA